MTYARARCAPGSVSRCGVRGWSADGQWDAGRAGDRFHSVDLPHSGGTHHPGQGLGGTARESVPTATGFSGLSRASLFHGRPPSAVLGGCRTPTPRVQLLCSQQHLSLKCGNQQTNTRSATITNDGPIRVRHAVVQVFLPLKNGTSFSYHVDACRTLRLGNSAARPLSKHLERSLALGTIIRCQRSERTLLDRDLQLPHDFYSEVVCCPL